MTPSEFRIALEGWQIDVDVLRFSPLSVDFIDLECHYGSARFARRFDCHMLSRSIVDHIAMACLGKCLECGGRPIHPNVKSVGGSKCRGCEINGGGGYLFKATFDLDELRVLIGPVMLRKAINKCLWRD